MESDLHQKVLDRLAMMGLQYTNFAIGSISGEYIYLFKCEHGCSSNKYENDLLRYKIICNIAHTVFHFHVINEN
jgi:hypothetical protein